MVDASHTRVTVLAPRFYRAILCKFLVFLACTENRLNLHTRITGYLLFSVQLQEFMRCICCGVEEIYGDANIFCETCKSVFNVECKLCQFYNFMNNKIF